MTPVMLAGASTDLLQPGDIASFTIDPDTTSAYVCTLHPGMNGRIERR